MILNNKYRPPHLPKQTVRNVLNGDGIHCLLRLKREGVPERFSRSWQLVRRNVVPFAWEKGRLVFASRERVQHSKHYEEFEMPVKYAGEIKENKKAGRELYEAEVVMKNIPNRAAALEWEQANTDRLWAEGHSLNLQVYPKARIIK